MERFTKIARQISVKNIAVHIVGIAFAGGIIWGVSYLLLVTFSIQENTKNVPAMESSGKNTASTSAATTSKSVSSSTKSTKSSATPSVKK